VKPAGVPEPIHREYRTMPTVNCNGVNLYYEEAGSGIPIVFVHEFAGDHRSWEAQVRFFSARYRAVTYSARGYPPSDVPDDPADYGQEHQVDDLKGLLDALSIDTAHLCGLSMGSYTTLLFGLRYPRRARSLTIAGSGYGSSADRAEFQRVTHERAKILLEGGIAALAETYTLSPTRVQFQNKNPRAWEEFRRLFDGHSAKGSAYTLQKVQAGRPSILALGDQLRQMTLPALVMLGDEDDPGLEGSVFMKRHIPRCGLEVFPRCGHTLNLEEPGRFNRSLLDFITAVDAGHWEARDPRAWPEPG
jgi:pimeloyl-ACP methyl ester carboxylesterase